MSKSHNDGTYDSRKWRRIFGAMLPQPCCRCGGIVTAEMAWDVDHYRIPSVAGGPSDFSNLAVAHRSCNRRHGQALSQSRQRAAKEADERIIRWV